MNTIIEKYINKLNREEEKKYYYRFFKFYYRKISKAKIKNIIFYSYVSD